MIQFQAKDWLQTDWLNFINRKLLMTLTDLLLQDTINQIMQLD